MIRLTSFLLGSCLLIALPAPAFALGARLSWSPVASARGYKIYVRSTGHGYGSGLDVGQPAPDATGILRVTVVNVTVGAVLAVTSYDVLGNESVFSNELTLPPPPPTPIATVTVARPTATPTPLPTRTLTAVPTAAQTAVPTATRTAVPVVTATATRTAVPVATATATRTAIPVATATATRTAVPVATATVTLSAVPAATPTVTRTAVPVATATDIRTAVPVATATVTRTAVPDAVPTPVTSIVDLTTLGTIIARVPDASGGGNRNMEVIRDGDMPPPGNTQSSRQYDTFDGRNAASEDWIGYAYQAPQRFRRVVFQEGRHFWDGGWFETLTVQVRQDEQWVTVGDVAITPAYPGLNATSYETFTLSFPPVTADAIRIYGRPGGSNAFISVGELRVHGEGDPSTAPPLIDDVTAAGSPIARVTAPTGGGNHNIEVIRDGDMPPPGNTQSSRQYDTYDGRNSATEDWIGYAYAGPQRFRQVLFQEGRHFWNGGWFDGLAVQVRQNGQWVSVVGVSSSQPYPGVNAISYERFMLSFPAAVGDAIRIYGAPGGSDDFISVGELRVFAERSQPVTVMNASVDGTSSSVATNPEGTPATDGDATAMTASTAAEPTSTIDPSSPAEVATPIIAVPTATVTPALPPAATPGPVATSVVIELPLEGWSPLGDVSQGLVDDVATGAPVLAVAPATPDAGDAAGVSYPAAATLALPLPQLAFTVRTDAAFEVDVVVRSADGSGYVLAYRSIDADPLAADAAGSNAPIATSGARAEFAIGADMASGALGTTYRDLAADLLVAFDVPFAAVEQVRVYGALALARVALATDPDANDDTTARLVLPLAGWTARAAGAVFENEYDAALPGVTVRVDPTERLSQQQLTYPNRDDARRILGFGTLTFAVRDAVELVVEVKAVTREGGEVELTYEADRTDQQIRRRRAFLPLATAARSDSPYGDVRLDVAAAVAAMNGDTPLAGITSVTIRGAFTAGAVQLRDRVE